MKKLLSHLYPLRVKTYYSKINGELHVSFRNGKKTLDTLRSNYSFGSLQQILHIGLYESGFNQDVKSVLVLGMGAGSIVQTIREHFKSSAFIELVDIDSEIIKIAAEEFGSDKFDNTNIVCDDALEHLKATPAKFDLIVVDIFIIDTVPDKFTQAPFITQLANHLNSGGKVIYNTIRQTMSRETFNEIKNLFFEQGMTVKVVQKAEQTNDLIIGEKE